MAYDSKDADDESDINQYVTGITGFGQTSHRKETINSVNRYGVKTVFGL